jgi:CheY-like chemotaxis protein
MAKSDDPDTDSGFGGLAILVVEDHDAARKALCAIVRTFGATAHGAADGREALAVARKERLDLIFCDLRMPGMDGFEFMRQLHADPVMGGIPVIAMSGLGSDADLARIASAGFSGHLTKPVDVATMAQQLRALRER